MRKFSSKEQEIIVGGLWALHDHGNRTAEEKAEIRSLARDIWEASYMKKKKSLVEWRTIFENIKDLNNDKDYQSAYDDEWVTPIYLDPINETDSKWGLAHDEELFEEGFETEEEAIERLQQLENEILGYIITI